MENEKRRARILNMLGQSANPITGTQLAGELQVSRQVIVQDVAILRASGEQILATPRGYLLYSSEDDGKRVRATVACRHSRDDIGKELGLIVDLGGTVIDVFIEHPVYGELQGNLMISSRRDVEQFVNKLSSTRSNPLLTLTDGVHLHTIEAPGQDVMDEIIAALDRAGYLVK